MFVDDPFCQDLKASPVPPDLLQLLEKAHRSPETITTLSEEASARYKRIVGKLAWWSQTRPDHASFISLLATGQSDPTNVHENMLRRYLRFVRSTAHLFHQFPEENMHIDYYDYDGLIGISDASWGSSDVEKRRSVSGGLIIWRGCVVKSFSRLQGCVTLSSCEAEVVAVCQVAQECIGLRHLADMTELQKF